MSDARVQINLNELKEEEEEEYEIEDLTRPIGRDRAKADRARARRGLHLKRFRIITKECKTISTNR
ncbi:hypothetical protein R6Q57_004495 [Mikania cordata]